MRGPSVYRMGMIWRWGLSFVVALGSLLLALWLAARAPASVGWIFGVAIGAWALLNGWLFLTFPACPRCKLNVFLEFRDRWRPIPGQYLFSHLRRRIWRPSPACARCGLDLKQHRLFDPSVRGAG